MGPDLWIGKQLINRRHDRIGSCLTVNLDDPDSCLMEEILDPDMILLTFRCGSMGWQIDGHRYRRRQCRQGMHQRECERFGREICVNDGVTLFALMLLTFMGRKGFGATMHALVLEERNGGKLPYGSLMRTQGCAPDDH
jgi:hypothetical protein